jgi:hypothetical protein
MRRIGVLYGGGTADPQGQAGLAAFAKAIRELGWTPGRNITIEYRWADGDSDRMLEQLQSFDDGRKHSHHSWHRSIRSRAGAIANL